MDIQRWLESTAAACVDPEQHNPRLIGPSYDLFIPHNGTKRKRYKTDGSFLGPLETRLAESGSGQAEKITLAGTVSAGSDFVGSGGSLSSSSSSDSTSIQQTESSRPYRKRARHKTRPEKYETGHIKHIRSVTKRHKLAKHKSPKKGKREKTKKKEIKRKPERRSAGLVQTFHAKNVSRSRLTLDPTRTGLYTQGRASGPTRSRGLPDLIFYEMKFLQKGDMRDDIRYHTALYPQETSSSNPMKNGEKKRKTDRARKCRTNNRRDAEEKEISTYFQDSNVNIHEDSQEVSRDCYSMSGHMDEPIVKVLAGSPRRQFLGFGSSGKSFVSASCLPCPESLEPTVSSSESSYHQPRLIVIGRLGNTGPIQTIDETIDRTAVTENAIGSVTRLTKRRKSSDGFRKDSETLEQVVPQAENEERHPLFASNTKRFTQPVLETLHEARSTSPGKGSPAAQIDVPQSAQELSSSPCGKLLKECNATRMAANCRKQKCPEISKCGKASTRPMCTQERLAVSLPMPDIYVHQDSDTARLGGICSVAEDSNILGPEETAFVLQQAAWVEDEEHVDATARDDYYWNDERGSLGGEFYAELQHERLEHGQEDLEYCDVPVERCQLQSGPLDDFAGFWRSNTLY